MKKLIIGLLSLVFMLGVVRTALAYSFSDTVGTQPVDITVEEIGDSIKWTIDYPMEAPYDPLEGNGSLTVGLVIARDGEGNGPAYQIHNNDGSDASYPWGTWLMSPWGPTISDGWRGWHSGDDNTEVSTLGWVSATGGRYNEVNPDGIFTITIDKSELGESFHWALNLAIGSGFSSQYYTYEQMSVPIGVTPSFDWFNPLVDMGVPNYEYVAPPPDTTAPVVEISSPLDDAVLGGFIDIVGSVTDDVELSHYNLSLYPETTDLSDGNTHSGDRLNDSRWCTSSTSGTVNLTDDFTGNLCTGWDTTQYDDGEYQIRLAARDAAGNRDTSNYDTGNTSSVHVIGIIIDNTAPMVDITSHEDGNLVRGIVEVRGSVTDNNPHHYYAVLRDSSNGVVAGAGVVNRDDSFTDQALFTFDSTSLIEGETYTIWLAARDAAGNRDNDAGSLDTADIVIDNIPDDKDACKKGGWELYTSLDFKNQGACVSYLMSNEKAGKRN